MWRWRRQNSSERLRLRPAASLPPLSVTGLPEDAGREAGFSLIELCIVVGIIAIIVATSLPTAINAIQAYQLHTDASNISSFFNYARMRAASQYAPYRLDINTTAGTFEVEQLCGNTPSTGAGSDANCTSGYNTFSAPVYDRTGIQYTSGTTTMLSCRPTVATSYPGTITADPSGCPSTARFYFNTRGAPVDNAGAPLSNGGAVLYLTNAKGTADAVTLSIGGRATVWNWQAGQWYSR
jgi:prepilin-type N-terminal cleavage/methylation domain-containing protein